MIGRPFALRDLMPQSKILLNTGATILLMKIFVPASRCGETQLLPSPCPFVALSFAPAMLSVRSIDNHEVYFSHCTFMPALSLKLLKTMSIACIIFFSGFALQCTITSGSASLPFRISMQGFFASLL
jgi:hypothetical protein